MAHLDDTQLFLLRMAHKSLKNFLLTQNIDYNKKVSDITGQGMGGQKSDLDVSIGPNVTNLNNFPVMNGDSDSKGMLESLFQSQDECRRMNIQIEILDMCHDKEKTFLTNDEEANLDREWSYDDVLDGINDLKTSLIEREKTGSMITMLSDTRNNVNMAQEIKSLIDSCGPAMGSHLGQAHADSLDEQFRGLLSFREQVKEERNEHMKTSVELQITKEKVGVGLHINLEYFLDHPFYLSVYLQGFL